MTQAHWSLDGDYFENCNCEVLCPCLLSRAEAEPTDGECHGILAFHFERGRCGDIDLSGLNAAVLFFVEGPMARGNWTVGTYLDARATTEQEQALQQIFSGALGGPPALLAAVAGKNLGVKKVSITYQTDGNKRSLQIPKIADMNVEGITGSNDEQVWIDNVVHPVAARLSAARGTHTTIRDHGFVWDNSGKNGHFAPFHWQG